MKYSYVLTPYAAMIVRGTCIAWDAFKKPGARESAPPGLRERMAQAECAVRTVLHEEATPNTVRSWIRCIAYAIPFSRAPQEIMSCISEAQYKRRKSAMTLAIAEKMGLVTTS